MSEQPREGEQSVGGAGAAELGLQLAAAQASTWLVHEP